MGRDRIIVIGSFKSHLNFLEDAAQSGFPPFQDKCNVETSKVKWAEKLVEFKVEFCDILNHCDYDGEYVNASTIIDVISGRPVSFPAPVSGRVIPYSQGVRSVFFYIHTHGWSYAVPQQQPAKCDLCVAMGNSEMMRPEQHPKNVGHDHSSLRTREWYLGMPHAGNPRDFGSIVFPAEGKPCLNPFDKRLKSFVTQIVAGNFRVSDVDGSYPPLYKSHEWKDENGVVLKRHNISWDAPADETYFKNISKIFNHNKESQPIYMNMLTRDTARIRPDGVQDVMARLPVSWVEFLHYQNCHGTSTWVLNPLTSNCPVDVFLHNSETASSDAPFLLDLSLWQHYFQGFGQAIKQSPFTKFVACFDACGSGGLAKVRCNYFCSMLRLFLFLRLDSRRHVHEDLLACARFRCIYALFTTLYRSFSTTKRMKNMRKLEHGRLPLLLHPTSRFTRSQSAPGFLHTWKLPSETVKCLTTSRPRFLPAKSTRQRRFADSSAKSWILSGEKTTRGTNPWGSVTKEL